MTRIQGGAWKSNRRMGSGRKPGMRGVDRTGGYAGRGSSILQNPFAYFEKIARLCCHPNLGS